MFWDPDNETTYTIARQNLEYQKGRHGGWCAIGEPADDQYEDKSFMIMIGDFLVGLIADTPQDGSIKVIKNQPEEV